MLVCGIFLENLERKLQACQADRETHQSGSEVMGHNRVSNMTEQDETDPYETGREAAKQMLEILEGEVVETVGIEKKGPNYPRVKMVLSEYPIQEFVAFPKYIKVDGAPLHRIDFGEHDSRHYERLKLVSYEELPNVEGHNLELVFETTGGKVV